MSEDSNQHDGTQRDDSRRGFIRGSSLLLAGALPAGALASVAPNSQIGPGSFSGDQGLKVGLVGCGYQGISAISELILAASSMGVPVTLAAMADAFPDRMQQAVRTLRSRHADRIAVTAGTRFVGLQAFRGLLNTDIDLVLLATPPVFRPAEFEAAVEAGKHVHVELPVAIDVPGLTRFHQAANQAQAGERRVTVGWMQSRDQRISLTTQQLQQGIIGPILSVQALHPAHAKRLPSKASNQSEYHFQLRNWMHFPWSSGGGMVERRVRTLALVNSLMNAHPAEARSPASEIIDGGDHSVTPLEESPQVVEYIYPSGSRLVSQEFRGQSIAPRRGCMLAVHGTTGWCDWLRGEIYDSHAQTIWRAGDHIEKASQAGASGVPHRHAVSPWSPSDPWEALLAAGAGEPYNGIQHAVESTLTAIMGRMAVQQRKPVTWGDASQSTELFDCNTPPAPELGVDRAPTIERYLTASDS